MIPYIKRFFINSNNRYNANGDRSIEPKEGRILLILFKIGSIKLSKKCITVLTRPL